MSVSADIPASTDLLGKIVTDLQENIAIGSDSISGTLKYVTGYTGFSGDVSEQSGNYLALKCDGIPDADEVTFELVGGTVGHPVVLDSDRLIVVRITNTESQYIVFTAKKSGITISKTLYLTGLTLATA